MRAVEKGIIIISVVVFITVLGMGMFDVYVEGFEEGLDILLEIGEHSTNAIIDLGALLAAVMTFSGSKRGRNKRGKT